MHIPSLLALTAALPLVLAPGDLTPPPGPISPTMKTLDEVEARRPVNALDGVPLFAHEITESGSYYLTGDIDAGSLGGISIAADDVTVDLNGFTISGDLTNGRDGIRASGSGVTIRNGRIRSLDDGIATTTATEVVVEDVVLVDCPVGVRTGSDAVIRDTVCHGSGIGFSLGGSTALEDCHAVGATSFAYYVAATECSLTRCTARTSSTGVFLTGVGDRARIEECHADDCGIGFNLANGNDGLAIRNTAVGCITSFILGFAPGHAPVATSYTSPEAELPFANVAF